VTGNFTIVEFLVTKVRLKHIDRMKAIAVLCMVEVHTAAIIPPKGVTVGHPAAFVAAAFGGMAAPMFVTISGWAMYNSAKNKKERNYSTKDWVNWIFPRVVILTLSQLLVNLFLNVNNGGRFEWHTPGVLTLLAISAILAPFLIRLSLSFRVALAFILAFSPILIGEIASDQLSWFERVSSENWLIWIERLLWNGTYPLFPWLFFSILGTIIFDLSDFPKARDVVITIGLFTIFITIAYSLVSERIWALTNGDAILTFFPASMPFLLVSGTIVILVMRILEGDELSGGSPRFGEKINIIEPAGRLSLTIYVCHFAVLGIVAIIVQDMPRLDLIPAFIFTIGHTIIWIPLAQIHEKNKIRISLENLIRIQSGR